VSAKLQGGFRGGRKAQGGWVAAVLGALSIMSSMAGNKAAVKREKAQKNAINAQWAEEFRAMNLEARGALGTQESRYAASGVTVGVGSAATVTQQTKDEYARAVAADAYLTQQKLKGAKAEGKAVRYAQVGGYFSSLASMANSYSQYQASKPDATSKPQ
jgi:hypothetical protein